MHHNNLNLSLRFRVTFLVCAALLVVLFLYFLHHYAPPHKSGVTTLETIDTQSNATLMRGLLETQKELEVPAESFETKTDADNASQMTNSYPQRAEDDSLRRQESVQSPISVYGGDVPTVTHSEAPQNMLTPASVQFSHAGQGDFMNQASSLAKTSISDTEHPPQSPYEIKAGSLIPAILVTGINSDLPGKMIAKVSQNVYDSKTGNYLLIPQGTTLLGVYDSQVAHGQERVLIAWQRVIFPNGNSIQIEGQPGVDLAGQSGLHDTVNNHYRRLYGHAMMFSILSAAGQLSQPKHADDHIVNAQESIYASVGQQLAAVNAQSISQNLNVQPTIEIRPGTHFNVLLAQDLALHGTYQFDA